MNPKVKIDGMWPPCRNNIGTKEFINDLKENDYDAVIVQSCPEFELFNDGEFIEEWSKITEEKNIDTYILLGSAGPTFSFNQATYPSSAKTIYFPFFFGYLASNRTYDKNKLLKLPITEKVNPDTHYISLVNKSHPHRCKMMDNLKLYNILKDTKYTWHQLNNDYIFKYWDQKISKFDDDYDKRLDGFFPCYNEIYSTSFHIINETTPYGHFFTEKTFQPISWGKPFVIMGSPGDNLYLKEVFGFELWDELFDYDRMAEYDSYDILYEYIAQTLDAIRNRYTPQELWNECKEKAFYNKKRYTEIIEKGLFIPKEIVSLRDKYGLSNEDLGFADYINLSKHLN